MAASEQWGHMCLQTKLSSPVIYLIRTLEVGPCASRLVWCQKSDSFLPCIIYIKAYT